MHGDTAGGEVVGWGISVVSSLGSFLGLVVLRNTDPVVGRGEGLLSVWHLSGSVGDRVGRGAGFSAG